MKVKAFGQRTLFSKVITNGEIAGTAVSKVAVLRWVLSSIHIAVTIDRQPHVVKQI